VRALAIVLTVLTVSACGRFGFDENRPADAASSEPQICNARMIGSLPLTGAPVKLRATPLSTGHALAVQTDAIDTHLARLDATDTVVSTHMTFFGNYALQAISEVADRPFVYVFVAGAGYIKLVTSDWNTYDTGPSGEQRELDPQQVLAPDGTFAISGVIAAGTLKIQNIDVNNTILGQADYAPFASFASFGAIPSGARVVVENGGSCETFTIDLDGKTGPRHAFAPCFEPRIATLGSEGAAIYRTSVDGPYALHQIPANANDPGTMTPLEVATNPRIATIDGAIWVGYLRNNALRLVRFAGDDVTMHDDPSITTVFDLLPSGLFWVTSSGELHAGTPCS